MKIAILIGDGMGDYALPELGGLTPLQKADIPVIRSLAAAGLTRLVQTIPDGMAPGSDVANLSMMGFDPHPCYTGRAPIEAAGAGVPMEIEDVAFRCNLITVENERMVDHSGGHISTEEARPIIDTLQSELGRKGLRFASGASYRHLVIWDRGPVGATTTPPHDVLGQTKALHLPRGEGAEALQGLMEASRPILERHPVIQARRAAGKKGPTQIWLWGQGKKTVLPNFKDRYGLRGAVISAVDLVRGIGLLAGLKAPRIPGATGWVDTNYAAKVSAALGALEHDDFVFVHVEAPDECAHVGRLDLKLQAIEAFDREVAGPMYRGLQALKVPYRLIIGTDHRTPVTLRNHTIEPVPLTVVEGPVAVTGRAAAFDETVNGGHAQAVAYQWIHQLLS